MGRINVLPPEVVSQIAAGEVIERPASVVKELIENSIDAGARRILVRLEDGGRKLIAVSDDGCGMEPEDAVAAFQRHATSKIRTPDDLLRVTTMGFRGEALPSIAAVSQVELITRSPDQDQGVRVEVEGGVIKSVETAAGPVGTIVSVRNLFFNTPARLKFLRSGASETNQILAVLTRIPLSFPQVTLLAQQGEREIFCYHSSEDPRASVAAAVGKDCAYQLVPITLSRSPYRIWGFASPPSLTRPNRSHQWFFVNRRFVRSRLIAGAVTHAYHGLIPDDRQPIVILHLEVPPELLDVNVHPAKLEVRFHREGDIQQLIVDAIRSALTAGVPSVLSPLQVVATSPATTSTPELTQFRALLRSKFDRTPPSPAQPFQDPQTVATPRLSSVRPSRLTAVAQLAGAYILAEGPEGTLFIVSQHRAHERYLFDQIIQKMEGDEVLRQNLIVPFHLEVGQSQWNFVHAHLGILKKAGFVLEPFGRSSFLVRTIPALFARLDYQQFVADLIDELSAGDWKGKTDLFRGVLATVACRAAIKAGDPLSLPEMQKLLDDLLTLDAPALCPHGQPVLIAITKDELDRRFER
ncbi:MAG: DNA mismatch repair endonuclease MutL [Armatimonadetes bacterium]|nr:DNA mismatch repair endonuclease MutL [Armatimonadota bacterium]